MMISILSSYLLSLKYSQQDYLDSHKKTIKAVVQSTASYLKPLLDDAQSEEDKLHVAHKTLEHLRYDNGNYLFIYNIRGFNVIHPMMPELEGQDLNNITDSNGIAITQLMLNGIKEKGDVFWQFLWPRPGSDIPVDKLGYALLIPGTDWIIGTGIYLDDLAATLSTRNMAYTASIIFSLLFAYIIASRIAKSISVPASRIVEELERISQKEFDHQILDIDRQDEMGRIAQALLMYRKQTEENSLLRQENEKAKYLQSFDPITQLLTRKALEDALTERLEHSKPSTFIIVKIPLLRDIQAQWGNHYCNQVINVLTGRLREMLAPDALLARHSDDSFAIVLEHPQDITKVRSIVLGLQELIMQPTEFEEHRLSFQSRIGISFAPEDGLQALQLISHAEEALGEARRLELDYMFFNQLRTFALDERLELWKDIQTALDEDQFHLVFQPLYDLRTNQILSAEVLLRWEHPTKGFISPAKFVSFAEQSGLVSRLDNWVLKATARQIFEWKERQIEHPPLAINLSGLTFVRCDLQDLINSVISIYPIPLSLIELELTEGVLVESIETLQEKIDALKKMGIHISIDDFGTGYSSLSRIRNLPIDKVKIDRAFVEDLESSQSDKQIIEAITHMAQGLGFKVVAEGVETLEQLNLLRLMNCDIVQGFLLSRPVEREKFEQLLENQNLVIELD